ncbi:hypothetical protein [Serratia surfactantfaciens]|uniref:hypothetical protein n=1 Tax=Serratia surfactantfaciens TaxID=2741499 RepID=UPI003EDEF25E
MRQVVRAVDNNPAALKNNRLTGLPGRLEAGTPFETPIVITLYFGRIAGRDVIRRYFDRAHDFYRRRGRMMVVGKD